VVSSQPVPNAVPSLYASLGRRVAAHLLDVLVAFSVLFLAAIVMRGLRVFGLWMPDPGRAPEQTWQALGLVAKIFVLVAFVLSMGPVYFMLWEASPWQATMGKRLLNIYVTDDNRQRISLGRSVGRWLARWICGWFGGNLISMITIASTGNRKAIHDFLGKTLVLRGRPLPGGALEPWRITGAFVFPALWLIGTFLTTM
jgi:uncharacterized RDD family membrane protein YckC